MADIRCPQCGKSNPAGSATCWNCQAPLTTQQDLPDWLDGLRGSSESSPDSGESPSEGAGESDETEAVPGEQPDWLARIRQDKTENDSDDWLKKFSSSSDTAPQEEDAPDWLNGLRGETPSNPAASEDAPDWLKGLQASDETNPAVPNAGEDDWLKGFQTSEPASAAQPAEPADWMQSFRAESASSPDEPASDAAEPAAPAAGEVDWLKGFQAESGVPVSEPDDGEQDWLKSFQADAEQPPAAPTPPEENPTWMNSYHPPAGPPAEAAPGGDWLGNLRAQEPVPPVQPEYPPAAPEETGPAPVIPDWMADWGSVPPSNGVQATPPAASNDEESDWLHSQSGQGSASTGPTAGVPDWLSSLPAEPEPPAEFSNGLTDWLSTLPQDEEQSPATPSPISGQAQPASSGNESEPPVEVPPAAETGIVPAEPIQEAPAWLKAFASNLPNPEEPPADEPPTAGTPFSEGDLPDWLSSEETAPGSTPEEPAASPFSEDEGNLEEAQVPGWLQAMRPVESALPQGSPAAQQSGKIEKSGPLAGLMNALPGEDLVTQVRKPPAYSSKLQVSERQRQAADMIEQMLSDEARPQPPRPERSRIPERTTRVLIALALVAVLLLPLLANTGIMPLPNLFPKETVVFHNLLSGLPANAPVLVAVDYEPGLSGELSLSAAPVMEQLARQKIRTAVFSTVPTGPALAESLLVAPRSAGLQVVNLGFLPGGTAGLQELAQRPHMALRYTLSGEDAWTEANGLAGVDSLQKFAAVIVLTENAETARAWIEQVQPRLGSVPLLFVASAQAAPMIQPYLDSGQVQGMVSGMAGGVMYAQIAQSGGLEPGYWDAYQFGLFAAVFLILLGGVVQLFAVLIRRPARRRA